MINSLYKMQIVYYNNSVKPISSSLISKIIRNLIQNYYDEQRIISYCENLDYENINKINSIYIPTQFIIDRIMNQTDDYENMFKNLDSKFLCYTNYYDHHEIVFWKKLFNPYILHDICRNNIYRDIYKIIADQNGRYKLVWFYGQSVYALGVFYPLGDHMAQLYLA